MTTTTLFSTQNCHLRALGPTKNYHNFLIIGGANSATANYFHGLLQFDVSSLAGETVSEAKLRLSVQTDYAFNAGQIDVYRSLVAWIDTQATWNIRITGTNWSTAGADGSGTDREATTIGTKATTAADAIGSWVEITLSNAGIQGWIDGGLTNNGIVLRQNATPELNDGYQYDAATDPDPPELVLIHTAGIPGIKSINGITDYKSINGITVADIKALQGQT